MRFDGETKEMLLTTIIGGISAADLGGNVITVNVHFVTSWRGKHTYESHGDILCYTSLESSVPKILGRLRGVAFDRVALTFEDGGHVDVYQGTQYCYSDHVGYHDPPLQG